MFRQALIEIDRDLKNISSNKTPVIERCIMYKLDESYKRYETEIDELCEYLLSKKLISVIKATNKILRSK